MFQAVELIGKIDIDTGRIDKTLGLIPDRIFFLCAGSLNIHDFRGVIDAFAIFKYRNQKLAQGVGAAGNPCLFPRFIRVKEVNVECLVKCLIGKEDQVRTDLYGCLIVNRLDGLV